MIDPRRQLLAQITLACGLGLGLTTPPPSFGSSPWIHPVIGAELVNDYRQSETPYSSGHRGVDYRVRLAQGVFAPNDGVVHFVGEVVDRPVITLDHGIILTSYEPVCSRKQRGEQVRKGDLIGEICEGDKSYVGHCQSSSCLHFSMREDGEYLSPLWLIGELERSRLLPWVEID